MNETLPQGIIVGFSALIVLIVLGGVAHVVYLRRRSDPGAGDSTD